MSAGFMLPDPLALSSRAVLRRFQREARDAGHAELAAWFGDVIGLVDGFVSWRDAQQSSENGTGTRSDCGTGVIVSAKQLAMVLPIGERAVVKRAPALGGEKVAGRWKFDQEEAMRRYETLRRTS